MKKLFALLFLALFIMVSCNINPNNQTLSQNHMKRNDDARLITTEVNSRSGEFTEDVVIRGLERREQNLNIMDVSNSYNQEPNDIVRVREEISKMDQYHATEVTITGQDLRVITYYNGTLSTPARAEAVEDIRSHLLSALPYYAIEIIVKDQP